VEVDHVPTPGSLVQPVHILRQENLAPTARFKLCQSAMRVVRLGLTEPPPAYHAAGPITTARQLVGHESLKANRLSSFPIAIGVSVIRNS
jgi:hypothetical protein